LSTGETAVIAAQARNSDGIAAVARAGRLQVALALALAAITSTPALVQRMCDYLGPPSLRANSITKPSPLIESLYRVSTPNTQDSRLAPALARPVPDDGSDYGRRVECH